MRLHSFFFFFFLRIQCPFRITRVCTTGTYGGPGKLFYWDYIIDYCTLRPVFRFGSSLLLYMYIMYTGIRHSGYIFLIAFVTLENFRTSHIFSSDLVIKFRDNFYSYVQVYIYYYYTFINKIISTGV